MRDSRPAVLVLTSSYPGAEAGRDSAGCFVQDFCRLLNQQVRVIVIAPGTDSAPADAELEVRRFFTPSGRALSSLSWQSPVDVYWMLRVLWSGLRLVLKTARENRHSLIHILALWVVPCGLWARLAARRNGVRYSTWALGSDIWSFQHSAVRRAVLRFPLSAAQQCYADGLELAADVTAISQRSCSFLASARLLPPVAPTRSQLEGGLRLHFLGRWHPNKGIDLLLQALARLTEQDWSRVHEVVIAGGGLLEDLVSDHVALLQRQHRPVRQLGYLGPQQAAQFIAEADYLLLPSRVESIPVILSDAVHCGTPMIVTPVGDLPELHARFGCGVLSSALSAKAIADSIGMALQKRPASMMGDHQGLQKLLSLEQSVAHFCADIGLQVCAADGQVQ